MPDPGSARCRGQLGEIGKRGKHGDVDRRRLDRHNVAAPGPWPWNGCRAFSSCRRRVSCAWCASAAVKSCKLSDGARVSATPPFAGAELHACGKNAAPSTGDRLMTRTPTTQPDHRRLVRHRRRVCPAAGCTGARSGADRAPCRPAGDPRRANCASSTAARSRVLPHDLADPDAPRSGCVTRWSSAACRSTG